MATRYIKKYADETAIHTAVDNQELLNPYVAYDESAGTIDWNSYIYIEPLTFEITSAGTINVPTGTTYSIDGGEWENTGTTLTVSGGESITFKGNNASYYNNTFSGSTATFNIKGNIMSLIDSTGFNTATTLTNNNYQCFYSLFRGCKVVDASKLILPATTLAGSCYDSMFYDCKILTAAPELPATTLADYCYRYMFSYCSSLTTAPELPAQTLTRNCYFYMFQFCGKLNYIKCLATDISAFYCTRGWVTLIASTGTFVKNPDMNDWTTGNDGIPNGWTVEEV